MSKDEEIAELKQQIENIRKAMNGYHDSDLVSLGEFLNKYYEEHERTREELDAKSKFLNVSIAVTVVVGIVFIVNIFL